MASVNSRVVQVCKEKLLEKKSELLNRVRSNYDDYKSRDRGGDETDQALDVLAEEQFLNVSERLRHQLLEVEIALAKIEKGIYGVCEETDEPISQDRLLAIPWTRLSIEGAEMREDVTKRYAK